jgi:hypothetical protein
MTLSVQFFMGERHGTFNGNYSSGVTGSVCFDSTPDSVAGGDRVGSRRIHQGRICRGCWNGRGALTFRGRNYPFKVSGDSLGATIGASITKFIGRAPNMRGAGDIAGTYPLSARDEPRRRRWRRAAGKWKRSDSPVARRQSRYGVI